MESFKALAAYRQFIVCKIIPSQSRPGKTDKLPVDYRTGKLANAHDSSIQTELETAFASAKSLGSGHSIGFVFTSQDPFWFLDIDSCHDGNNWSELSKTLCSAFPHSFVEVSSSGRGLHIIGSGKAPAHMCKNTSLNIEFYTEGRFVALTGSGARGDASIDCTAQVEWLVKYYFAQSNQAQPGATAAQWTNEPCTGWDGNKDDVELITRALRSKSAGSVFGNKASFADLWNANTEVLGKAYPDPVRDYDASGADAALAQHLAFWTGNDCERIRRLMCSSKLARTKWEEREDYLPRTILNACGRQKEFLNDKPPVTPTKAENGGLPKPKPVEGSIFLNVSQQINHFTGCVYVTDDHKILIPGGHLLTPDRFKAVFGGYTMPMDNTNGKVTDDAFKAFMDSKAFRAPRVHTSCFRPNLPVAHITEEENNKSVNIYVPIKTLRVKGDASRLFWHIEKLWKDPRDQAIMINYMAAIVQHMGIKFQWCPLIQGVEGNGKTLLSRCVAYAVGERYVHYPKAAEIASRFNDWLYQKIFIAVEDIYVPDSRLETMEALKPMITSEWQEIEPKGGAKITRNICANFIINTNHKDGLRKTRNDRRFAPMYTNQQHVSDLKRDGLTNEYFYEFWYWLIKQQGFAIICDTLYNYDILPEFNPAADCIRAPLTSSTEEAISEGLGPIEQELAECIATGLPGFKNGWVSSMMFDRLLERLHMQRRLPRQKRQELLKAFGLIPHPHLNDGRVNVNVMPDNGKPRLYLKEGHKHFLEYGTAKIAKAYVDDQK